MDIKNIYDTVIYTSPTTTMKDTVVEAVSKGAVLRGAVLRDAEGNKKKIATMRVFTGLYAYQVWAVLFEDGSRWVRMGCLFKSLDEWKKIGIRKSNLNQYPDDGSDKCEQRVRAFEYAKQEALLLKAYK